MNDYTLMISSCAKYSDLWEENINLLNKNWPDRNVRSVIVTDTNPLKDRFFENIEIFEAGELDMPQRSIKFLQTVDTKYVLYSQDDYFFTNPISNKKVIHLVTLMNQLKLDYLRIRPYPKAGKLLTESKDLRWLKLDRTYDVNMYTSIWTKDFITKAYNRPLNIWQLEVTLTKFAVETGARCVMSTENVLPFLDVLDKGKVHYKAAKFLNKQGIKLNRVYISLLQEIFLFLKERARDYLPRSVFVFIKKVMKRAGLKFYSDTSF